MMNQEWYCTTTVIAHSTIVFMTSTLDSLKTQIWYFMTLSSRATICQQAHWTRLSGEVLFEGKPRLQSSRRRILATELACSYQANLKNRISHSHFDETSLEVSTQNDHDYRFVQELFAKCRHTVDYHVCITSRFRNACSTNGKWERHEVLKTEGRAQC